MKKYQLKIVLISFLTNIDRAITLQLIVELFSTILIKRFMMIEFMVLANILKYYEARKNRLIIKIHINVWNGAKILS